MRKEAFVIDLDNTIVDTAKRKHALISSFLPQHSTSEATVRQDFSLTSVLGQDTEVYKSFMRKLDSDEGIRNHPAPALDGVVEFIKKRVKQGISVIVMTARPEALRGVTLEEFAGLGIDEHISELHMLQPNDASPYEFKTKCLDALLDRYDVVAFVGDRLEDMEAAKQHRLPFILLRTTYSPAQILQLGILELNGGDICSSWRDVDAVVETVLKGRKKLSELRDSFTASYAGWLADLDNKCRVIATISGVLAALGGKILLDIPRIRCVDYLVVIGLACSILSLLYCIRSMTSRRTSGAAAGTSILARGKQWFAILFGAPQKWDCQPGDAIDTYRRLLKGNPRDQGSAHLTFFFEQFHTYDPESLANLRLLQLRSVNHSKAYAESLASKLLVISIISILLWLTLCVAFNGVELANWLMK